jgi:Co/Zn/Cd efflux system component
MSDDDHAIEPHNSSTADEQHKIGKSLSISIALKAIIFIVELVGSFFTNCLALITGSLHNSSIDWLPIVLSA